MSTPRKALYLGLVAVLISATVITSLVDRAAARRAPLDAETLTNIANALWMQTFEPSQIPPAVLAALLSPHNSNSAFGKRATAYLRALLNNPTSFDPDYSSLYENLGLYSSSISPQQQLGIDGFRGLDRANGYLQLPEIAVPTTLTFPEADAVDLTAQFGWYYVVGNAMGADGKQYGILVMLLFNPLLPPQMALGAGLTMTQNMVTQLQFEVNQAGGKHYVARPVVVAGTTGLLNFGQDIFSAAMGKNFMQSLSATSFFPMQMAAAGWDYSSGSPVQIQTNITFTSGSNRVLQGSYGCLPCCGGIGTLYYSIPQMKLGAGSSVTINGKTIQLVSGNFWLDHQWGTNGNYSVKVMRAWNNTQQPSPGGWDWFGLNFTGDRSLWAVALHSSEFNRFYGVTGPTPPPTMTVPLIGNYVDATGTASAVKGTLSVTDWIKATSSPDPRQFAVTNVWYPNRWQMRFPTLPADLQSFTLAPIVDEASTLFFATGDQYQEAPVTIVNSQNVAVGSGFAEATGYATNVPENVTNRLQIANLPDTPAVFAQPSPSPELVSESTAFISQPQYAAQLAVKLAECLEAGLNRF